MTDVLPAGLPMPRRPESLNDPAQRVKVKRGPARRFPFPVPNGWFIVATADELAAGDVVSRYYFARELVVFRDEAGAPHVIDAYCPHLGAHIGVGGRVEGECIRCPFHGWLYEGASGRCVEIPYAEHDRIPSRAFVGTYPTLERNRMIWAWHHAEGKPPFYDVPEVPEFSDDEWHPVDVRDFVIAISCQDMAENNVDYAHFRYMHGSDAIPEDNFITDGTYKRASGMDGNFVREGYGLGLGVLRVANWMTFLSSTTPIDEENVHVRWVFTAPKSAGDDAVTQAADALCAGISQDIPIWENKIYRDQPVLTKSEKAILEHRRWCLQFYSGVDDDEAGEQ